MNAQNPLNYIPIIAQNPYENLKEKGEQISGQTGDTVVEQGVKEDAGLLEQGAQWVADKVHDTLFKPIYDATTEFTNTVLEAISTYWMKLSVAPIFQPPTTDDQGITTPGTYDQLFTNTNQGALVQVSNGL